MSCEAQQRGFRSKEEMKSLVSSAASAFNFLGREARMMFSEWSKNDGTKEGLLKIIDRYNNSVKESKESLTEKLWEIWAEGYVVSGSISGVARLLGTIRAKSFRKACEIRFNEDEYFDSDSLTYWGCRLFDNETEARISFG